MKKHKSESYALFLRKYYELCNMKNSEGKLNRKKKYFKVIAKIKPTKSSSEYWVEFYYKCNGYPIVWVYGLLSNEVTPKDIPHNYYVDNVKNKVELCLYRQKYKEYDKNDLFSENVIPWTNEWLHFFEIYLITGYWYGNGEHPKSNYRGKDYA